MFTGRNISRLTIFLILINIASLAARKIPDWVRERPIDPYHYIGIGVAAKSGEDRDYIQQAKQEALQNLAGEIEIKIASEVVSTMIEKSGILEEELKARIRSTTQAELEGFELLDTWEDKKEYWVYYRLNKERYQITKRQKLDRAIALAGDFYREAKQNEGKGDMGKAIVNYLQALQPIEPYLAEPLAAEFEGRQIYLNNEVYFSLQRIMAGLLVVPKFTQLEAKSGRPITQPLAFQVIFREGTIDMPVANLPLEFGFLKGEGELVHSSRTNDTGWAKTTVSKVISPDKMQMVQAEIDLKLLSVNDSTSFIYQNIIKSLPVASAKTILNVSGLSVQINSTELNLGKQVSIRQIEPRLKAELAERGYSFTDDPAAADILITLEAETREGSFLYNMYSVFAEANLSVVDMSSGEEIYKQALNQIKGIDLDREKAGLKALGSCGDEFVKRVVPVIVEKM